MESNSESKKATFEVKLQELKKELNHVIEDAAEAWFKLVSLKSVPEVPAPNGTGVLPATIALKQINQRCAILSGLFEALSLIDPSLVGETDEADKEEFIGSIEKATKPLQESIEQIKKAIDEAEK
jgi:hypothetical protein